MGYKEDKAMRFKRNIQSSTNDIVTVRGTWVRVENDDIFFVKDERGTIGRVVANEERIESGILKSMYSLLISSQIRIQNGLKSQIQALVQMKVQVKVEVLQLN